MPEKLKLIFVHPFKTGGVTIREALKACYTPEEVFEDDVDRPSDPVCPIHIDPEGFLSRYHNGGYAFLTGKTVVAGHLWIRKYDPVKAQIRATILREPVERAISNYFYWLCFPTTDTVVLRYVVDNSLDILAYAALPIVKGVYRDVFFRDVDMAQFDFIGDYANLKRNWEGTLQSLGVEKPPPLAFHNTTNELNPDYHSLRQEILDDPKKMAKLRSILADDIRFYERHAR